MNTASMSVVSQVVNTVTTVINKNTSSQGKDSQLNANSNSNGTGNGKDN